MAFRRAAIVLLLVVSSVGVADGLGPGSQQLPLAAYIEGRQLAPAREGDGLRVLLHAESRMQADSAEFFVRFENHGGVMRLLNLGLDRRNEQWPLAVRFLVSKDDGPTEVWRVADGRVAGRLDALLVWLLPEESFGLRLDSTDFMGRNWIKRPEFPPGRYRAAAEFTGTVPTLFNSGQEHMRLWTYWVGTLISPTVEFAIEPS